MAFLGASLETLVKELVDSGHDFNLIKNSTLFDDENDNDKNNDDVDVNSRLNLLLRKHAFPYEIVKSCKVLKDMTSYPPRSAFYSELKGKNVTQEAYNFGKEAFKELKCANMLKYMEVYNQLDTLLLCECMSSFQKFIMDHFGLDMVQYVSIPGT